MKKDQKTSECICLLFDEMYLQKRAGLFGDELLVPTRMENYSKIMIVGLKESTPYVIKLSPEKPINASGLEVN